MPPSPVYLRPSPHTLVVFVRQAFFAPPDWRFCRVFSYILLIFAKTTFIQFTDKLFVDATWEGEGGKRVEGGGRGQLSQTCSRRNNRWLLNRKHTRFLWGRRYRYENVLALRKRTTCLVSSVSFVSRFLPVNKPGLHPPAAARHPSSKHKARWLVVSWCRKAWRYSFAMSLFLFLSLFLIHTFSLSVAILILLSHLHMTTGSSASYVLIYVGPAPLLVHRFLEYTLCLPFRTKGTRI